MPKSKLDAPQQDSSKAPKDPDTVRNGRKFAVSSNKGKAKGKVRYIETNDPSKGCRFL